MNVKLHKFVIRISKLGIYAIILIQTLSICMAGEFTTQQKFLNEISIELSKGQNSRYLSDLVSEIELLTDFRFSYAKKVVKDKSISILEAKESDQLPQIVEDINVQTSISEKVANESGEPLPGAIVLEKGTTNGTITDVDGKFQLSVNEDATLLISFVGYVSQEINVTGRNFMGIQMLSDSGQLEEVVVMGYGTIRKSDLTGAVISQIDHYNLGNTEWTLIEGTATTNRTGGTVNAQMLRFIRLTPSERPHGRSRRHNAV